MGRNQRSLQSPLARFWSISVSSRHVEQWRNTDTSILRVKMLVRTDFVLKYSLTSWLLATFGFAECNEYQITFTHCLIITHEAYTELKMDISHCSDVSVMASQTIGNSNSLFNNLFKLTPKKPSKLRITISLWGESTGHRWFPSQWDSHMEISMSWHHHVSPPGQNGRHFADDILKWIFVNEKVLYLDLRFTEICS